MKHGRGDSQLTPCFWSDDGRSRTFPARLCTAGGVCATMAFPDPRADAETYLDQHKVRPLFQELGTRLMFERPADPNAFLVEQLTQMQKLASAGKPTLFFNETDVTTMFEMFDPTGRGSIDTKQYNQALRSFGVEHGTVPLTPGRKYIDKEVFKRNVMKELSNRALSAS